MVLLDQIDMQVQGGAAERKRTKLRFQNIPAVCTPETDLPRSSMELVPIRGGEHAGVRVPHGGGLDLAALGQQCRGGVQEALCARDGPHSAGCHGFAARLPARLGYVVRTTYLSCLVANFRLRLTSWWFRTLKRSVRGSGEQLALFCKGPFQLLFYLLVGRLF